MIRVDFNGGLVMRMLTEGLKEFTLRVRRTADVAIGAVNKLLMATTPNIEV